MCFHYQSRRSDRSGNKYQNRNRNDEIDVSVNTHQNHKTEQTRNPEHVQTGFSFGKQQQKSQKRTENTGYKTIIQFVEILNSDDCFGQIQQ